MSNIIKDPTICKIRYFQICLFINNMMDKYKNEHILAKQALDSCVKNGYTEQVDILQKLTNTKEIDTFIAELQHIKSCFEQ